jgi:hypothetical protein
VAVVSNEVRFRRCRMLLSQEWTADVDEQLLVAALPESAGLFRSNLVVNVSTAEDEDPLDAVSRLPGSVLLSHGRHAGPFPGTEAIFGYALAAEVVTVLRLVGDPTPDGRYVITFSAGASRFGTDLPAFRSVLESLELLP